VPSEAEHAVSKLLPLLIVHELVVVALLEDGEKLLSEGDTSDDDA
jgi:hypothetical protein